MTELPNRPSEPTPRPPAINGPAFLVFGLLAFVLGISLGLYLLIAGGVVLSAVGIWGIAALRRYEREAGIEDVLPGQSPHDMKKKAEDVAPDGDRAEDQGDETT